MATAWSSLAGFQMAETGMGGLAVHFGMPVGIDGAAVLTDVGKAERPTDAAGLAGFPRLRGDLAKPVHEQGNEFRRLHDALLGNGIGDQCLLFDLRCDRGSVRVGGGDDDLAHVHFRKQRLKLGSEFGQHGGIDGHEIAGNKNGLIRRLASLEGLDGHGGGEDGGVRLRGNARVKLSGDGDRAVRRDIHGGGTDSQLGGAKGSRQEETGEGEEGGGMHGGMLGQMWIYCHYAFAVREGWRLKSKD